MMRQTISAAWRAALMIVVAGLWLSPGWANGPHRPASATADEGELHDIMEELESHFRSLRRNVRQPEKAAETQETLHKMETLAVRAKQLQPDQASEKEGEERDKFVTAYRLQMIQLLDKLLATERAVLEKQHDKAADLVKEVYMVRRDAHREFRVED